VLNNRALLYLRTLWRYTNAVINNSAMQYAILPRFGRLVHYGSRD